MTSGTPLGLALIGHLVGDYLLQNDWMANNKKRKDWTGFLACEIHCFLWTCSVCLFSGWGPVEWFVLHTTHFVQDHTQIVRFWMTRVNRQPRFVEPPMAPWSLVVVDNVWHIVTIWAVWRFIA